MVKDIEEFGAELDVARFAEFCLFQHGEVHIAETRPVDSIAAAIAKVPRFRQMSRISLWSAMQPHSIHRRAMLHRWKGQSLRSLRLSAQPRPDAFCQESWPVVRSCRTLFRRSWMLPGFPSPLCLWTNPHSKSNSQPTLACTKESSWTTRFVSMLNHATSSF